VQDELDLSAYPAFSFKQNPSGLLSGGFGTVEGLTLMAVIKPIAVLAAAIILGNWFLAEMKRARLAGAPWYKAYLTLPGVLIVIALSLPLIYWLISR